jgi:hypothetical protein
MEDLTMTAGTNGAALRLLAVLVGLFVAADAQAQSWQAKLVLLREASIASCQDVPDVTWDLKLEGGVFSGSNNYGAKFSAPVSPDGLVSASYTGRVDWQSFAMEMTGNVNVRLFVLYNPKYSCRYKLVEK